MQKKPEQLELPFTALTLDSAEEIVPISASASVICLNTARVEQHIERVHKELVSKGFVVACRTELKVG